MSVTDGMAHATLGTNTGGLCRIPAALCGIVGFKSTAGRISTEGVVPLSYSLDSVGPLANSVSCCAVVDAVIAGGRAKDAEPFPVEGLRLGAPRFCVLDDHVARSFEHALRRLSEAGTETALDELAEIPEINKGGGIVDMEAYAWHRPLVEKYADRYDPWILARFDLPKQQSAADYIDLLRARRDLIERVHRTSRRFDALVMPTVAITAPTLAELEGPEASTWANMLVLRNTMVGNFLDRTAISLPCHGAGEAPVGLLLIGEHGDDRRLLSLAAGVEGVVSPNQGNR